MAKITIDVEDELYYTWKKSSIDKKRRINEQVATIISQSLETDEEDLWPYLEKVRKNADSKGFNDQILDQLLND